MEDSEFYVEVQDLLADCLLTHEDIESGADLRKMKTMTAYTDYYLGKSYQSQRNLSGIPAMGGSKDAQEMAENVSLILRMDETIQTILNPSVIRLASKI